MAGLLLVAWGAFVQPHARHPGFLLVILAFFPLVWKNAAATMDYLWSLAFVVLAYRDAHEGRPIRTGLWVGIAGGIRLVNAAAFLPAAFLLHARGATKRDIAASWIVSLGVVMAAFLPVIIQYGIPDWWYNTAAQVRGIMERQDVGLIHFGYRTVYAIGPLAVIVLLALFVGRRRELVQELKDATSPVRGAVAGIVLCVLMFSRFPFEREYLLPAVPLLLILVDRVASRIWIGIFASAALSFALVNPDVVRHEGWQGVPALNIHDGIVVDEWRRRDAQRDLLERVPTLGLPARSILMTGLMPELWVDQTLVRPSRHPEWENTEELVFEHAEVPERYFVFMLSPAEIRNAQDRGYRVWCLDRTRPYLEQLGKYSMQELGVRIVLLDSPAHHLPIP
jgi:hypothetical protein